MVMTFTAKWITAATCIAPSGVQSNIQKRGNSNYPNKMVLTREQLINSSKIQAACPQLLLLQVNLNDIFSNVIFINFKFSNIKLNINMKYQNYLIYKPYKSIIFKYILTLNLFHLQLSKVTMLSSVRFGQQPN